MVTARGVVELLQGVGLHWCPIPVSPSAACQGRGQPSLARGVTGDIWMGVDRTDRLPATFCGPRETGCVTSAPSLEVGMSATSGEAFPHDTQGVLCAEIREGWDREP